MTWSMRMQSGLIHAIVMAGTTFGGLLMADAETTYLIGLTMLNAFGAFGAEMGMAGYRAQRARQ